MNKNPNLAIRLWLVIGLLAYLVLPWYAIQDTAWYSVLPQIFGGTETANGLLQALLYGRSLAGFGLAGLGIAAMGLIVPPGKSQGSWLLAGGLLGFLGLLLSGFMIGAKGWSFEVLNAQFGELAVNQFGIGIGAFMALLALVMITAFGVARRGFFKGDLFIASAVLSCSVLLLLFIAFPGHQSLVRRFFERRGALGGFGHF